MHTDTEKTLEQLKAYEEHRTAWIKAEYETMGWSKPEQKEMQCISGQIGLWH